MALVIIPPVLGTVITSLFPKTYFEWFLNRKFAGYQKMDGRVLRCETYERSSVGFEVKCQYFRGDRGEEYTYQLFSYSGDYISSLDGG